MTVRERTYTDPKTGAVTKTYFVDVTVRVNGRKIRHRERAPVQRRRAAEMYDREVRQRLIDGDESLTFTDTFSRFVDEWFDAYRVKNSKSEAESKEAIIRLHLKPFFGDERLASIDTSSIDKFIADQVTSKASPKSINNRIAVLNKILVTAHEWRRIPIVPKVKWLHVPEADKGFLTFEEADKLITKTEGQTRAMIVVGLRCGLRLGEILALRWQDVDLKRGVIRVRHNYVRKQTKDPKGKRSGSVPLGELVKAELQEQRARSQLRGELVFCRQADGAQLTKDMVKRPLWRACEAAGIKRIGWHTLRHTFASHLVMRGVNLRSVMELMRHTDIKQTMIYSHLAPHVNRDAVMVLDQLGHAQGTAGFSASK